jgi:hypothetical protein
MRNEQLRVAGVGILLIATATSIAVAARSQLQKQETQRIRTIVFQPGVPIAERLLPEDKIVVVKRREILDRVQWVTTPTAAERAYYLASRAQAAIVLTVSDISGEFTEGESWIRTEISAIPTEVLFAQVSGIATRRPFRISWDEGGERIVDLRQVRAGTPLNLRKGDSCLMFLVSDGAGLWRLSSPPLAIERGRLVDTTQASKSPGETEPLEGLKVESVVKDIRRAAARMKKRE